MDSSTTEGHVRPSAPYRNKLAKPRIRGRLLNALRKGCTRRAACAYAGVSEQSLWVKLGSDVDFAELILQAENEAESKLTQTVVDAAPKDWKAGAWWLERRRRAEYGPSLDLKTIPVERLVELYGAFSHASRLQGEDSNPCQEATSRLSSLETREITSLSVQELRALEAPVTEITHTDLPPSVDTDSP